MIKRIENDAYYTHQAITQGLLDNVVISGNVSEPCCGEGHIAKVLDLSPQISTVTATDIKFSPAFDATTKRYWRECSSYGMDWVVTNPPFKEAEKILPLAFEHCNIGVAFLLRLTYLEPTKGRQDWLIEHADNLRHIIPVNPRPRFRTDTGNSDSVTVAWFVWKKDWSWEARNLECPFKFIVGWR